jgi:hypothetical protein
MSYVPRDENIRVLEPRVRAIIVVHGSWTVSESLILLMGARSQDKERRRMARELQAVLPEWRARNSSLVKTKDFLSAAPVLMMAARYSDSHVSYKISVVLADSVHNSATNNPIRGVCIVAPSHPATVTTATPEASVSASYAASQYVK